MRIDRAIIAAVLLLPLGSLAGNWHRFESLVCSDCHTMHGSQAHGFGGGAVSATPAPGGDWLTATSPERALLKAPADQLCLACHDGSISFAPDVVAPVGYVADAAGGAFETVNGTPSALGHDLHGSTPVTPPDGDTAFILTCRTCHDTHGNANFRNLRPRPSGSPLRSDVVVTVDEAVLPNGSNPAQVYVASNLTYKAGMSGWCRDCHSGYDEAVSHPVDRVLYGSPSVDWAWWRAVDPALRVRVQNPQDRLVPNYEQYDQVFCISCHKAHGSSNPDALIYADGVTGESTCLQCHNR